MVDFPPPRGASEPKQEFGEPVPRGETTPRGSEIWREHMRVGIGVGVNLISTSGQLLFENCFNEPVVLAYEVGRGTTHSGTISAQAPCYGGTAADVLTTTVEPNYNASDADFGGHPSAEGTGTQWLQSTTPASAVEQSQPLTRVLLCRPMQAADTYLLDGTSTKRCGILAGSVVSNWKISAGTATDTGVARDQTQACLVIASFTGAGAWSFRVRKADGTLDTNTGTGAGSNTCQGATWHANSATSVPLACKIAAQADVVGALSAGTLTNLENYLVGVLGWDPLP